MPEMPANASAEEIKGKIGENLRNSVDQIPMSRDLATIRCNLELDEKVKELKLQSPDEDTLRDMYTELEFRTWLDELSGDMDTKAEATRDEADYQTVLTKKDFNAWLKRLKKAKRFAFDTETTSLNYMQARVVGVSFAIEVGEAAYVPFGHDYPGAPKQLSEDDVLGALKPLLEDPKMAKIGQNLKYDAHVLANHGIEMQGIAEDTMLESYVLDSTRRHDMDNMALRLLGHNTIHFEDIAGKGAKQLTFNEIDLEQAGPYAAEDADITLQIHEQLSSQLEVENPDVCISRHRVAAVTRAVED